MKWLVVVFGFFMCVLMLWVEVDVIDFVVVICWYLMVGFMIGVVVGGVLWVGLLIDFWVGVLVVLVVWVVIIGVLYLDGLVDLVDGLGVVYGDWVCLFSVMVDLYIGSFGVVVIVV